MECYLMTGDSDYLLRVLVPDIEDLEDLIVNKLSRIQGVSSIKSNLALKKISHKTMLPIDSSQPLEIKPCYAAVRHRERAATSPLRPACSRPIGHERAVGTTSP
jgi:hypothetical protein